MRRRLIYNNEDGIMSESIAYGGTIAFDGRPTEAVSFECPGCTHFAIMPKNIEINSGTYGALFISVASIKGDYTTAVATYPTGIGGFVARAYTDTQYASTEPIVSFTETGVTMEIGDYSDSTYIWFGGLTYEWIAW